MSGQSKLFCIGFNKTGTSSLAKLFQELGFTVPEQYPGETLARNCAEGDFKPLFDFVNDGGDAFQDMPFSMPGVFKPLAEEFRESKFILTVRDSQEVWYKSLVDFHSSIFGKGKVPKPADLQLATYGHKGWAYEAFKLLYKTEDGDLYNQKKMMYAYEHHIYDVREYFKNEQDRLLVVNLKHPKAAEDLSKFLNLDEPIIKIPHTNSNKTILHKIYRRIFKNYT